MDLIDRFKYIMKLHQMNAANFADEIGVQRSSVSHILSGRNKPSLEFIQKILLRFPKVDSNWLISGKQFEKDLKESEAPHSERSNQVGIKKKVVEEQPITQNHSRVAKIMIFYADGTFEEFKSF